MKNNYNNQNKTPHHRLLNQLKKGSLSFNEVPKDLATWQQFLSVVNRSYHADTESRQLLERSLEVSSEEMHTLYEELKDESEQRISAIQKSEQKMLFMANMSHEIRTPIHGILGSLDVVRQTELDERQKLFIDTAHVSCEAMLDIINNILDYSKISADKFELEMTRFSLRELVEEVNSIMAMTDPDKPVEVISYVAKNVPQTVRGDSSRIRQMLINLVGNGLKFTESGEVYTRVEKRYENEHTLTLRFEVRDTGIGIPKDMQKNIFNSFVQVDASITRRYGGTGLGLTIVKEFAELMNGSVGVESVEGKGSLFWFEITLDKVEQEVSPKGTQNLEGLSVLIVDDMLANRQIFNEYLSSWGATPTLASSGTEALELMVERYNQGKPFDLVLLDWFMPGMDGLSVASQISQDPRLNSVPLVLLSSYSIAQEKLDRAGVKHTLTKPIRSSVLRNMLIEVIKKDTAATSNRQTPAIPQASQTIPSILLAEDNDVNALIAKTMLENEGLEIHHVMDGKQVVEAVKKKRYSMILMDIHMPDIDGYSATRLIRQWESKHRLPRTPIIAMTANALKGDREKCLETGMDDYLAKPVSRNDLIQKVSNWIKQTQSKQQDKCPA